MFNADWTAASISKVACFQGCRVYRCRRVLALGCLRAASGHGLCLHLHGALRNEGCRSIQRAAILGTSGQDKHSKFVRFHFCRA